MLRDRRREMCDRVIKEGFLERCYVTSGLSNEKNPAMRRSGGREFQAREQYVQRDGGRHWLGIS